MVDRVRDDRGQLAERDATLRSALNSLGDALTATHDRTGIIAAVLDTSVISVAAECGIFFAVVPGSGSLRAMTSFRCESEGLELAPGDGLAGAAIVADDVVHAPEPGALSEAEPDADTGIAVPLRRGNRTIGVLAVYGRRLEDGFGAED